MRKIVFILVLVALSLVGTTYIYQVFQHKERSTYLQSTEDLLKAVTIVNTIWTEGDYDGMLSKGKIDCLKYTGILHKKRYSCNPKILQCFVEKLPLLKGISLDSGFHLTGSYYSSINNNSYRIGLIKNKYRMDVALDNSCHEVYLPQRIYTLEDTTERKKSWWDNLNRHIFVDKFLVTNFDIQKWLETDIDFLGGKDLLKTFKVSDFNPAIGLRADEMKRYCMFHGKQVLNARLFDAASMHPGDVDNVRPKFPVRSKWPWDRKNKSGPIYKLRQDKEAIVTKEICMEVYSKECAEKFPNLSPFPGTSTWSGVFQVLGDRLEYLNNEVTIKKNLKASSSFFPIRSRWNELGKRAFWDGTYFGPRSFNFRLKDPDTDSKNLKVGFRCYREIY